jgi:uncharacterized protein (TIGR03067 family)
MSRDSRTYASGHNPVILLLCAVPFSVSSAWNAKGQTTLDDKNSAPRVTSKADAKKDNVAGVIAGFEGNWSTRFLLAEGEMVWMDIVASTRGVKPWHPLIVLKFRGREWIDIGPDGTAKGPVCTLAFANGKSEGPGAIDLVSARGVVHGIYRLDKDALNLCINADETVKERPTKFIAGPGLPTILLVCERIDSLEHQRRGGPPTVQAKVGPFSLNELSADYLRTLNDLSLQETESRFTNHIGACVDLATLQRTQHRELVKIQDSLKPQQISRFDRWCDRDTTNSFRTLVVAPIQRETDLVQQLANTLDAAVESMTKQLRIIQARRRELRVKQ